MKLIIKKEIYENCVSFTAIKIIPRIFYPVVKWYYQKKGYEVEALENE